MGRPVGLTLDLPPGVAAAFPLPSGQNAGST